MEPDQERINRIMERTGTNEHEARIVYHLDMARNLLFDLPRKPKFPTALTINQAVNVLYGVVKGRVLARDYPQGWATPADKEEQDATEGAE